MEAKQILSDNRNKLNDKRPLDATLITNPAAFCDLDLQMASGLLSTRNLFLRSLACAGFCFFLANSCGTILQGFTEPRAQIRLHILVTSRKNFLLRALQFFDAGFQAESLSIIRKFERAQHTFRRESLGKFRASSTAMLFKASLHVNGVARINTIALATEHIDEMRHIRRKRVNSGWWLVIRKAKKTFFLHSCLLATVY